MIKKLAARVLVTVTFLIFAPVNGWARECISERILKLNPDDGAGFGKLGHYPQLPLKKGEYVLTFDDGPNSTTTPKILDSLKDYCVHATFFMLGKNADASPDLVKRVAAEGNSIGTHTFSHANLTKVSQAQAKKQIDYGIDHVERALGSNRSRKSTRFFRFPNNVGNSYTEEYLRSLSAIVISYDITALDWQNLDPNLTFALLEREISRNDRGIIILHDVQPNTVKLLPKLLEYMSLRNLTIVHIEQK